MIFRRPQIHSRESLSATTIPGTPPSLTSFQQSRNESNDIHQPTIVQRNNLSHHDDVWDTTAEESRAQIDDDDGIFVPETQADPTINGEDASNGSDFFQVQPGEYESNAIVTNTQSVDDENTGDRNKPIDQFHDELTSIWKDNGTADDIAAAITARSVINGSVTPDLDFSCGDGSTQTEFLTATSNEPPPTLNRNEVVDAEMSALAWNEVSTEQKADGCQSEIRTPDLVMVKQEDDLDIPSTYQSECCGFSQQPKVQKPSDYYNLPETELFVRHPPPPVNDDCLEATQIFVAPIHHNDKNAAADDNEKTQIFIAPQKRVASTVQVKIPSFFTETEEDEDIFAVPTQVNKSKSKVETTNVAGWQHCLSSSSDDDDDDGQSSPTTKFIQKTLEKKSIDGEEIGRTTDEIK